MEHFLSKTLLIPPLFRFNPFLSEYFPLDEVRADKIATMRADTRMYLRRNHNR